MYHIAAYFIVFVLASTINNILKKQTVVSNGAVLQLYYTHIFCLAAILPFVFLYGINIVMTIESILFILLINVIGYLVMFLPNKVMEHAPVHLIKTILHMQIILTAIIDTGFNPFILLGGVISLLGVYLLSVKPAGNAEIGLKGVLILGLALVLSVVSLYGKAYGLSRSWFDVIGLNFLSYLQIILISIPIVKKNAIRFSSTVIAKNGTQGFLVMLSNHFGALLLLESVFAASLAPVAVLLLLPVASYLFLNVRFTRLNRMGIVTGVIGFSIIIVNII